jgi:hypothetical protein
LHNDTILLFWNNYNEELLPQTDSFMNLQRYALPVESPIDLVSSLVLNHSVFAHPDTDEIWLIVESDKHQNADIELYDVLGRHLNTMPLLVLQPAIYQIKIGGKQFSGRFVW